MRKELNAVHTEGREAFSTALSLITLSARAHGIAALDGVFTDVRSPDALQGLARECAQAKALGMDGKTLIHPQQVDAANFAFTPSADAVEAAQKIIDAHAAAISEGKGVTTVDGSLIENLHVEEAKRALGQIRAIREMEASRNIET